MRRGPVGVLLSTLLLGAAGPALGQPAAPAAQNETELTARAAELNQQAAEAFNRGELDEAASLLKEAYLLISQTKAVDPVLLFNLGKTNEKRADAASSTAEKLAALDEAIWSYNEYLNLSQAIADREQVRKIKETLEARRAELQGKALLPDRAIDSPSPSTPRESSWKPYALMGAGVALVAAGGWFGYSVQHSNDLAESNCVAYKGMDADCGSDTISSVGLPDDGRVVEGHTQDARRAMWLQFASYGVGGAALVGGAVWWYLDRRAVDAERSSIAVQVGPGSLGVVGRF